MRVAGIVRTARGQLVRDRAPEPVDIGRSRIGPSTDGLRESRREQGPIGPAQLRPSSRGAGRGGFKSYLRRLSGPGGGAIERHNYRVVQLDSVAMGVVAAATPFLPVFLARLGGSNFEVGLLTTLPALGGLLFAIPFGQLIQRRRNVVPWYS